MSALGGGGLTKTLEDAVNWSSEIKVSEENDLEYKSGAEQRGCGRLRLGAAGHAEKEG